MLFADNLPTVTEYRVTSMQIIYPHLNLDSFWLQKINEIALMLPQEVNQFWLIIKKYKWAKNVINWSTGGSSFLSVAFLSARSGSALSVVGLRATIPLNLVGVRFARVSSDLIISGKKLDSKIKKKNIKRLLQCYCKTQHHRSTFA